MPKRTSGSETNKFIFNLFILTHWHLVPRAFNQYCHNEFISNSICRFWLSFMKKTSQPKKSSQRFKIHIVCRVFRFYFPFIFGGFIRIRATQTLFKLILIHREITKITKILPPMSWHWRNTYHIIPTKDT